MNHLDGEENFISGIHNYCDRWCERCSFTARCRVFAMEQEDSPTDEERDINNEAFWRKLAGVFAQTHVMLREKAEELGIDIETVSSDEFSKIRARERAIIKGEEIAKLAEKYARNARPVLEAKDEWLEESSPEDDIQSEVIEVSYWYQFFISAKIQRGLHGILDADGDEDIDEISDPQSDANGSVKIALIAIERSILAWTYLLTPQNTDTLQPMIELLEEINRLAEQKFPNAWSFMRPGFDEIETVM